jgi:hypothetical protein
VAGSDHSLRRRLQSCSITRTNPGMIPCDHKGLLLVGAQKMRTPWRRGRTQNTLSLSGARGQVVDYDDILL